MSLRRVTATRYAAPLREGGSLPGLLEADDDGLYVVKFRAAGQGVRALVAEVIAGELARAVGLPVPELVLVDVPAQLAPAEPDQEIQDLLRGSTGTNLGMDFLSGAIAHDPTGRGAPDASLAAAVVWFDALVLNVDRTPRNPNLLVWHGRYHLIDHGAALFPHHGDWRIAEAAGRTLPGVDQHVLLPFASSVTAAGDDLAARVDPAGVAAIVDLVPDDWLGDVPEVTPAERRAQYAGFITRRLGEDRAFAADAEAARVRRA